MSEDFRPTVVEQAPVAFQTHGFGAHLLFDDAGLSPYWGVVSVYEPDHEDTLDDLEAVGETWQVDQSRHWEGQLAPPDGNDHLDGGMNEYQYQLVVDDDVGDKDITIQFRPGYPDATNVNSGEPIQGIPDDCPESVRVQVMTTNLDVDEILPLLRAFADHVGLNAGYFGTPHEYSSAYQIERYGRLDRSVAENKLTGGGGIMAQIADFASGQSGRGMHKWDHEDVQAHYEAVALDPDTWELLIPEQRLGKQFKVYHPKLVRDAGSPDPLSDPKVEISLSSEYDTDGTVPWEDVDQALADLDQAAANVLSWADVPIQPTDIWNDDDEYFDVCAAEEPVTLHANPLPSLRDATEHHVESELIRQDLTQTDQQLLEAVTDGGAQHYEELAESADTSTSAVYRLLDKLSSLLDSDNGVVGFADEVTRSNVSEIVDQVRDTASWASESLRRVVSREAALSAGDAEPNALEKWMNRHGIEVVNQSAELRFKLRHRQISRRELAKIIRSGLDAAESSGLESAFRDATISWTDRDGSPMPDRRLFVGGRILGTYDPMALH